MAVRIGIDVMGGDHAPEAILRGCFDAIELLGEDDTLVLIGPQDTIKSALDNEGINDPRLVIEHASEVIAMDASPIEAVRSLKDSTIVKMSMIGSQKVENPCDAVISAGNTGACVAAGQMNMRRLRGVHRPGIAVTIPSFHGPVTLCDAGANPEPRATHLWQYGLMAEVYARKIHGIESPRVGVMNIGTEESKGSGLAKGAFDLLKNTPDVNFIGYVEGRDFFAGRADVIVTDGFLGNTLLKMAEGMAKSLFKAIGTEIAMQDPELAQRFEPVVRGIYKKNDYHEHGGAPLLGVNGVMMIAHGSSEPRTIKNAIRATIEYVNGHINDEIIERLAAAEEALQGEPA